MDVLDNNILDILFGPGFAIFSAMGIISWICAIFRSGFVRTVAIAIFILAIFSGYHVGIISNIHQLGWLLISILFPIGLGAECFFVIRRIIKERIYPSEYEIQMLILLFILILSNTFVVIIRWDHIDGPTIPLIFLD